MLFEFFTIGLNQRGPADRRQRRMTAKHLLQIPERDLLLPWPTDRPTDRPWWETAAAAAVSMVLVKRLARRSLTAGRYANVILRFTAQLDELAV